MMATVVLSAAFAVFGLVLSFLGWISMTIGRGHWWFVGAAACFSLAGWGTWEMLS